MADTAIKTEEEKKEGLTTIEGELALCGPMVQRTSSHWFIYFTHYLGCRASRHGAVTDGG